MAAYIVLLRKEDTSDFGVDFPDIPGCVTAGSTLEEARHMAVEALTFHIEGMAEMVSQFRTRPPWTASWLSRTTGQPLRSWLTLRRQPGQPSSTYPCRRPLSPK